MRTLWSSLSAISALLSLLEYASQEINREPYAHRNTEGIEFPER